MIPGLDRIVEERIKASQKRGDFDNLPGSGKPLVLDDDSHIPEDLRLPFKILKNADCLPPEIETKKEIERTEDLLAGMRDTAERYRTMKRLNFLILKLNATRSSSVLMDVPQQYMDRLTERIEAKHSK